MKLHFNRNQTTQDYPVRQSGDLLLSIVILLSLFIAPIGGIVLMFYYKMPAKKKIRRVLTAISCVWFIILLSAISSPSTSEPTNTPQITVNANNEQETTTAALILEKCRG